MMEAIGFLFSILYVRWIKLVFIAPLSRRMRVSIDNQREKKEKKRKTKTKNHSAVLYNKTPLNASSYVSRFIKRQTLSSKQKKKIQAYTYTLEFGLLGWNRSQPVSHPILCAKGGHVTNAPES